jgi:hypothetical protein
MVSYNCALDMTLSFISWDALNGARLPALWAEAAVVPDSLGSSLAEEIGHLASDVREVRARGGHPTRSNGAREDALLRCLHVKGVRLPA